ncbi:alpha/beta fold hydrolase [Agrobacterium sp. NPDC090283]|uniref:alpha/beta fold hydrolase n=1 Tax=Agrobacterium sp. NPDC090283 TaxID=3363920 RepID=UPI003839D7F5
MGSANFALTDDNLEIYFEVKGEGKTIVFVPGYFGIHDIWTSQTNSLSKSYRTVAYDSRGYGSSAKPLDAASYSIPRHAEDLKAVLDAAGVTEPVVLVAHSIGGNIASTFAFKYPDRVAGLVYAGCYIDGKQMRDSGMSVDMVANAVATPSGAIAFYKPFGVTDVVGAEAGKWPAHSLKANAAAFLNHDMAEQYASIKAPALIIQGADDVPNPVEPFATSLQKALQGSRLEILPGVNHFPSLEAPEKVAALIEEHAKRSFGSL